MTPKKGTVALIGSGETTAAMVKIHRELLANLPGEPRAVFLDTPAGFELNVDQISQRMVEYFSVHVNQPMSVASYKGRELTSPYETERTLQRLREANFILAGPGSPTYAARQWRQTKIPEIIVQRIENGACLAAASAAALTVGRFTLPVYEIYKVGDEPHWTEGVDFLGRFGLNLATIPHWNNAEGGTHDTRFCYMGQHRFERLESLLPEDTVILGIDEHTVCILDFETEEASVKGVGRVTLRQGGVEQAFQNEERFSLELLRGEGIEQNITPLEFEAIPREPELVSPEDLFWEKVHGIEAEFGHGLETNTCEQAAGALLKLEGLIWESQQHIELQEGLSSARDSLREMIVSLGAKLEASPGSRADCLAPLVQDLLNLRETLRNAKQFDLADLIRQSLERADITVEDTGRGPRWKLV